MLFAPPGSTLSRRALPGGAGYEDDDGEEGLRRLIRFERVLAYPDPCRFIDLDGLTVDVFNAVTSAWREGQGDEDPRHHMLGHAMVLQNPMEIQAQLVSHGINTGWEPGKADQALAEQLAPGAEDWIPLLQLDSDGFFMWGDMGAIYFWIRTQDLAARDFAKAWMILQCG